MTKEEVVTIAEAMGFHLNYDQWDIEKKYWLRFELKDELDEKDLRWIWFRHDCLSENLQIGAQILFKAGQKAKLQQINQLIEL